MFAELFLALAKRAVVALEQIAKALETPPLTEGPLKAGGRELSKEHPHVWVTQGFGPTHCIFCGAGQAEFLSASSRSEPSE